MTELAAERTTNPDTDIVIDIRPGFFKLTDSKSKDYLEIQTTATGARVVTYDSTVPSKTDEDLTQAELISVAYLIIIILLDLKAKS